MLRQTAERIAEATSDAARRRRALGRRGVLRAACRASTPTAGLRTVAETLRAAISARPMRLDDGSELTVTATIGGTVQVRGTAARGPDVVDRADRALYAGKRRGRDRVLLDSRPARRRRHERGLRPAAHRAGARAGRLDPRGRARAALPAGGRPRRPHRRARSACRRPPCCARASAAGCTTSARSRSRTASSASRRARRRRSGRSCAPTRWSAPRSCAACRASSSRPPPSSSTTSAGTAPATRAAGGARGHRRSRPASSPCADAYSAITSDRVYRPERTRGEGIDELRRSAGSHLDPRVRRGAGRRAGVATRPTSPRASACAS